MSPIDSDYVDVATRIAAFNARYPDGSLQTLSFEAMTVLEKTFIVYRALAYRNPHDTRPGHGTAWEPFPGPTAFTRDSELMNAETSAWGRAIVAVGITASRKLATTEEVEARSQYGSPPPQPAKAKAKPKAKPVVHPLDSASDQQRKKIHVLLNETGVGKIGLQQMLEPWGIELGRGLDRTSSLPAATAPRRC